ncbi:MAG: hypothetical protein M3Q95_08150 [Bacteroidota bacterium]|nr:hypothetical protein [Bacteroidota bacterium]
MNAKLPFVDRFMSNGQKILTFKDKFGEIAQVEWYVINGPKGKVTFKF